jgi:hypothetical protein
MVAESQTRGQWLRDQRQARGWSVPQMRRQLREAAEAAGDKLPGNDALSVMIHRWEDDRSGISERYQLHYCRAFEMPPGSFGPSDPLTGPQAGGSCPDVPGSEQAGGTLAQLFNGQIPLGGGELQAAVQQLCDPANRDELCYLLGYASAMTARARHGTGSRGVRSRGWRRRGRRTRKPGRAGAER